VSLSQKDHSQAYESGKAKRRACGRIGDNPFRGKTEKVRKQHEAWNAGFVAQDEEIKAKVRSNA